MVISRPPFPAPSYHLVIWQSMRSQGCNVEEVVLTYHPLVANYSRGRSIGSQSAVLVLSQASGVFTPGDRR